MRKRIYIAGPISKGDLAANVNQATAAFVKLAKLGYAPMCPHWSVYAKDCYGHPFSKDAAVECIGTIQGNPDMTHSDWMGVDLAWVDVADAVLRLPGESTGADMEVAHAESKGIKVFHSIEEIENYRKTVWEWVPVGRGSEGVTYC